MVQVELNRKKVEDVLSLMPVEASGPRRAELAFEDIYPGVEESRPLARQRKENYRAANYRETSLGWLFDRFEKGVFSMNVATDRFSVPV
jgi:hypothetical protein